MIRIDAVTKRYDDRVAVDDVSLEIPSGSVFGLIGPNGAGKTTALKMIATLIKPDRGRMTVGGFDVVVHVREVRRTVGYMPDEFGTFRGLTCEQYLQFFGRAYGITGARLESSLDDVLTLTDLTALREESTAALSTGMRQRLSLAKTLLHDPTILILDEPASGLDPRARIEIRSLLRELAKMGKTIVISSHILADLEEICSHIGILEEGKVVWHGALSEALSSTNDRCLQASIQVFEKDADRALTLVRELECVESARLDGDNRILAELDGPRSNRVLRALIEAQVEVVSFSRERTNLESVFLERTRGIVS